ncbi:MAG: hypothetical protein U9R53_09665 [Chloroflexota bacterium]|nr:hypothetical protein [Chloroflexota bacterium]
MKNGFSNRGGWCSQVLYTLSLVCLGVGLFMLGWAVWPVPTSAVQIPILKGLLPGAPAGTGYASLMDYTLSVSWPRWLRVGDVGSIQLALTETSLGQGDVDEREVQIVVAEPLMGSLTLSPLGTFQANLAPGNDLSMTWDVEAKEDGEYAGKVLVSFGFYDEELDKMMVVPVAVVDALIIFTALWGMGSRLAMWFGLVGIVLWGVLFLLGRMAHVKGR